jgi:hypothetical protein
MRTLASLDTLVMQLRRAFFLAWLPHLVAPDYFLLTTA